jgi:hypothetical protein
MTYGMGVLIELEVRVDVFWVESYGKEEKWRGTS